MRCLMMRRITKVSGIIVLGISLWYLNTINKKYNNISKKLDMIVEISDKNKIDSLQQEIMNIGWKYDSLTLKYEHGWEFTN